MTGVSWKKTLLWCLAGIFLIILISVAIEGIAIRREIGEMNLSTRVAGDGALVRFSNLEFGDPEFYDGSGKSSLAYTAGVFNIKDNNIHNRYKAYLSALEHEAINNGIYNRDSDIKFIIDQLRESADFYRAGHDDEGSYVDYCYTPMQFGYSYLDPQMLTQIFYEDVSRVIRANYQQDNAERLNMYELAFTGMDRVQLDEDKGYNGVTVNVTGPILLYERNPNNARTFLSLFGSSRAQAMNMTGAHESSLREYDYVIAYDVEFIVHWKHKTITPFFRNWAGTVDRISANYLNDEDHQLEIEMNDIVFQKRYILTN